MTYPRRGLSVGAEINLEKTSNRFWLVGFCLHLCFVLTVAVLAYFSGIPRWLQFFPQFDLLGHFVLIGLLAFFLDGALRFRPFFGIRSPWAKDALFPLLRLGPALIVLLAGTEEVAQILSPNRTASLSDFAADVFGITLFSMLALGIEKRRRPRAFAAIGGETPRDAKESSL